MSDEYRKKVKRQMSAAARLGQKIIEHRAPDQSTLTILAFVNLVNEAKRVAEDAIDLAEDQHKRVAALEAENAALKAANEAWRGFCDCPLLQAKTAECERLAVERWVLMQADVLGHPDHETVCGHYPDSGQEWLGGLVTWLKSYDDQDPDWLARFDAAHAPDEGGEG
jgi:hypothetical protein